MTVTYLGVCYTKKFKQMNIRTREKSEKKKNIICIYIEIES